MKKRFLSLLLVAATLMGLLAVPASAAASVTEALGEIDIYNGGYPMSYLSINGRNRELIYTYYNYVDSNGKEKEIPAYCVDPNIKGVPQSVAAGESIRYKAEEIGTDPKAVGIVANGYPTRGLGELKLENKEQAYYATKMALWCYILPHWDINNLKVNPSLTGVELTRAQNILRVAKDIYTRGTRWNEVLAPEITCTPDRDTAYDVTVDGRQYKQQVFTFWSKTWVCDYTVDVGFTKPDDVPAGARIVDMDNKDITALTTTGTGDGYAAKFKVLYPANSVADKTGNVQLSFRTNVYKYAVFYAACAETDKYGNLQNYLVDTDPTTEMRLSAYSNYTSTDEPVEDETALRIIKLESGTETPLSGALFEVIDPKGATVGLFSTNSSGEIYIPLTLEGNYTVMERQAPAYHLLGENPAQNVDVEYGKAAEVTFYNAPYGDLRIEKRSDTGAALSGAVFTITHIESGKTYTGETNFAGNAIFRELQPGAYRISEVSAPIGHQADSTVYTTTVVSGETVSLTVINEELPGLRIIKYDRKNMVAMPGVTFEVFKDTVSLGKFQTDEFGEILLTDVEPGTYLACEVDTGSDGHILDTTPQQVELTAGDGIKELMFFNDIKPGLHLIKVDSSDPSKVIPNAVFEIKSVAGDYGPEEYTTDENGEIDLCKLPTGAYEIVEKSCPGYVIDDAQRIIQLDPNEDAQFVFTNSIRPSLRLVKYSSDGTPLAGAAFRIAKIEDGSRYLDRTTNTQGEILISDLEPGVYSVKETATDSAHILDPQEYHVELFPGQTSTIILENQKRPNLTVWKFDADTGAPISNTVFEVRAADGHSVDQIKTGADGSATLKNLLPGVYEITEKSVPSPYLLDAPSQLVTLYPNRDRAVYFENHQKPSLTVNKVCSVTGNSLKGAKFHVTYASNNTGSGEINDLGFYYSDANGQFKISNLKDGWYKVTEVESVPGYSIQEATQEVYIQSGTGKVLTFENTPLSALTVWKYDSVTGEAVEGAVFQIKYLTGASGTGGTVIGTYKTSANGSFTVTGLEKGTYIVEELASDSNHVIDTAPQTAYISGKDQDVVQLYFGNSPKGGLLITKKDTKTDAPLSDVEFFVTDSTGAVVGDANGKFWTDSAGSILIDGIAPGTTLVAKEVKAKDGYLLDDTPQTAVIKAGKTVTLEFLNEPIVTGNLIIRKLDSVTKKPLEGVQFKITYADGKVVDAAGGQLSSNGLYWTDKNGQITLSGITGTIVVTELETISGYTIHEESRSQTVVVNPDDTQTLWFYNDPIGGVELIKVNADDKSERIPGTTFEIRKVDDELVDTVTTDKNGRVFCVLEDGAYYAVEIEAAEGFKLDDTPIYFEVENGKTVQLRVTNEAESGILIHKTDATAGKGIYGISFILYDSGHNPIDQQTSDDRGYVRFEDLESGRYYLRELENEGYVPDTQMKTVYVKSGETTLVEWENTPITGQIQLTKRSADYNSTNGLPAGTLLEGAIFEIYDKANNLVDTIRSNSRGLAVSKPLPLGRYTIREVKAPSNYGVNETELTAYLEHEGQIVKFEVTNRFLSTGVSIVKTGPKEIMAGQPVRYTFSRIANASNVRLDNFYWRDTIPAQVRLNQVVTGTYNFPGTYKIVYRVNGGEYLTLADNLSTARNYTLDASAVALGLASNERVTEVMFVFGQAPAGFAQVEKPYIHCTAVSSLPAGSFVNVADVGGVYGGQWVQAVSRWVTTVYGKPVKLPRTGY